MICGRDPDDVFAYNTLKIVRVRDRYLGILRLLLMLGIFGYIVGFVLVYEKQYLATEVPVGTVYSTYLINQTLTKPLSTYPYCEQYDGKDPYPFKFGRLHCVDWDGNDVEFPADADGSVFLTTRVSTSYQTRACDECSWEWYGPEQVSYTANLNISTLLVRHSFQATDFYEKTHSDEYASSSTVMPGILFNSRDEIQRRIAPGKPDIISVEELLRAVGANFDEMTDSPDSPGESFRHAGMIITVIISYDNINYSPVTYTYKVLRVPKAEYKIVETIHLNSTFRKLNDRHGLKIYFVQTGNIGMFSFQVMLIQMVSALGLLSVATLVVDLLMVYVMPHRTLYAQKKYELTEDFSDVRDRLRAETMSRERFNDRMNTALVQQRYQAGDDLDDPLLVDED